MYVLLTHDELRSSANHEFRLGGFGFGIGGNLMLKLLLLTAFWEEKEFDIQHIHIIIYDRSSL